MPNKIYIKALDDWKLEVLGIPFGGPSDRDAQGEFFDARTNLHLDKYPSPPAVYYHGFTPDNQQGTPEYIGKTVGHQVKEDGVWFTVILDKTKELARRVWEAAKEGIARASSGSIAHLTRTARDGHILEWPMGELSLFDTGPDRQPANNAALALPVLKAIYEEAGIDLPSEFEQQPEIPAEGQDENAEGAADEPKPKQSIWSKKAMTEEELKQAELDKAKAEGRAEVEAEQAEAEKRAQELKDAEAAAVEAAKAEWEAEAAKAGRLPDNGGVETPEVPNIAKHSNLWKYDNLTAGEMGTLITVLNASNKPVSEDAYKAMAIKVEEGKGQTERLSLQALKRAYPAFKGDEVQYSTLASFGNEWVGVAYSNDLWEKIRVGTFVAERLPQMEVPQGAESVVIPLESGDPTYYKVAQTTDENATTGIPDATVTSSQMGTDNETLTLAKMGARVMWTGELAEDSVIAFVSQLQMQLAKAGSEQLEHAIIDGDITTTGSTNINDIGNASAQTATNLHLLFNGFRKSCLITTAANSRSGGVLSSADFLDTVKLMGGAGINALDRSKVSFILDPNTHYKALELADVKTKDVFNGATIEGGLLTDIWGYSVDVSGNIHFKSAVRKANSAGKVDQTTTSNNTKGAILAVRWDQWLLGWRRRMTMETTRIANADTTEIVALMRLGLLQRDEEASAISYNITL